MKKGRRLFQNTFEVGLIEPIGPTDETRACQSHGQRVTGKYDDSAGVVANQFRKAAANLHRRMPVICQGQDGARVLPSDSHEVGYTVDQDPGLAGSRPGEYKHVRVFSIIHNDAALMGVSEAIYNLVPRLPGGLSGKLAPRNGQPAL